MAKAAAARRLMDQPMRRVRRVHFIGIVGSGIMGSWIAEVAAKAGFEVVLRSRTDRGAQSMVAPWPGSRFPVIAAIGIVDTLANLLFALAAMQGQLAIVSVLGSLYPVATVLLGRVVLSERLSYVQHAGVALALVGVALLSAG